ncbi:uncharacterized protein BJ212DRAFT_1264145 [Suillus subaureus]|uniref:Zn(2)-C6 fungal-type domain-containing protein n=1 Tax=Suillus subaureus TaxID=48587 RepID=A0A9P7EJJ5_9AGAM|nr:uncharacterized protein BJ212DRAFT_1264145 [Suillus subaureus]KAG1822857.1 hypothetical protein BJ212DRAFT_1264145 [Suillus subaureus]
MSRPPVVAVDFVSQLSSALIHDPPALSNAESQSSRSPEQHDEEGDDTADARRTRREKPRIELAPDQPLTTQGKPRARVYVACLQCRTRKIRCDGAKPQCHNCSRRSKSGDECTYDAVPKRRGPDKTPGARQRTARDAHVGSESDAAVSRRRRRRRREVSATNTLSDQTANTDLENDQPQPESLISFPNIPPPVIDPQLTAMSPFPVEGSVGSNSFQPLPLNILTDAVALVAPSDNEVLYRTMTSTESYGHSPPRTLIASLDNETSETSDESLNITPEPSLDFTRKTWWDSLLAMYTSSSYLPSLTATQRRHATATATADIQFLLRGSNYWFTFINVPQFLGRYFDPIKRERMQPALLPAALAIAAFFQSSEAGNGREGRDRAIRLRDVAQGHLEASLNARWIDDSLAQAAWLLAFFEICPHPQHTRERASSSTLMLDMIIRSLGLTLLDVDNPYSAKFSPRSVPTIAPHSWSPPRQAVYPTDHLLATPNITQPRYPLEGCSCFSMTLGQRWPAAYEYTPLWVTTPGWDDNWSEAEVRKEGCRRLCWSALALIAGHTSYITAEKRTPTELFLREPANYALLFPGEALGLSSMSSHHSGKDTMWALIHRTMLLWHSCLQIRRTPSANEAEMARFGVDAWLEADALEQAFDAHTCDLERTFLFQGREFLFNVRMTVSHDFKRFIPVATANANGLFHRSKAEEWLSHQANVAQRVVLGMSAVTGHATHSLMHRPFFILWFMSQIGRALTLWDCDHTLTLALDVCTALFKPVDYLNALWPCEEIRRRIVKLRGQLTCAYRSIGRPPTSPSSAW